MCVQDCSRDFSWASSTWRSFGRAVAATFFDFPEEIIFQVGVYVRVTLDTKSMESCYQLKSLDWTDCWLFMEWLDVCFPPLWVM